ncbi:hypothetical protein OAQ84_01940, partial [Bdellovibrionales bacterium]|nr:hypothetical protein [Bdellovibrionales bacterium]
FFKIIISGISLSLLCSVAFYSGAQERQGEGREPEGWQVGVTTGPFLPNKNPGVQEMLSFWGLSISKDISVFRPELTLLQGHGKGHDYYIGMFSFRNNLPIYGVQVFWTWGLQGSYYTEFPEVTSSTDFVFQSGVHGSLGLIWPITEKFRLRSDMIFFMGPGRALYVGLGIGRNF